MIHLQPPLLRTSTQGYTCLYGTLLSSSYSNNYIELILSFQKLIYSLYNIRLPWRTILESHKYLYLFDMYCQSFNQIPNSRL